MILHPGCNAHNTHLVEYCLNGINKSFSIRALCVCVEIFAWWSGAAAPQSLPQMEAKERKRFCFLFVFFRAH